MINVLFSLTVDKLASQNSNYPDGLLCLLMSNIETTIIFHALSWEVGSQLWMLLAWLRFD